MSPVNKKKKLDGFVLLFGGIILITALLIPSQRETPRPSEPTRILVTDPTVVTAAPPDQVRNFYQRAATIEAQIMNLRHRLDVLQIELDELRHEISKHSIDNEG